MLEYNISHTNSAGFSATPSALNLTHLFHIPGKNLLAQGLTTKHDKTQQNKSKNSIIDIFILNTVKL